MTDFPAELARAMETRGYTRSQVAAQMGNTHVHKWLNGTALPEHPTIVELADLLDWPKLVAISAAIRTGPCVLCGRPGLNMRKPEPPRYCSKRCMYRANDRRRRKVVSLTRAESFSRSLTLHQDAVRAFCSSCTERTLICRQPACELRPVSPARLSTRQAA